MKPERGPHKVVFRHWWLRSHCCATSSGGLNILSRAGGHLFWVVFGLRHLGNYASVCVLDKLFHRSDGNDHGIGETISPLSELVNKFLNRRFYQIKFKNYKRREAPQCNPDFINKIVVKM